ncbi:MAG: 2TM domain-containing protein [bacterium]|nr:2TM domain-containing protein [bacterium]
MAKELSLEETVRRRIEKKLKERAELRIHAVAFLASNLGIWFFWAILNITFPFPLIITLGWSIGLFAHYSEYSGKYGAAYEKREALIAREIEKERARSYDITPEKAKNDFYANGNILLTEDGELSDSIIQELEENDTNIGRRNR